MGEPRSLIRRHGRLRPATPLFRYLNLCLIVLLLLPLPGPTVAMDMSSLWEFLGIGGLSRGTQACHAFCNCSTRSTEEVMQDYLTRYLPDMGGHMQPELVKQARATVKVFTAWIGNMADVHCHLPEDQLGVNLTDLLPGYRLSFSALKVTCARNSSVVWDLSALDTYINILDISGCLVEKATEAEYMAVPLNTWVLDLNAVPEDAVHNLDLSTAQTLLALSVTNTAITELPERWTGTSLMRLMVARLSGNRLEDYNCGISTVHMATLNLDHNQLMFVPACLLDGFSHAHHLSLRHNAIASLEGPLTNSTEDEDNPDPHVMYLDVAHNNLQEFPSLRKVDGLFALDVSHNMIYSLPIDAFVDNEGLQWLDLSKNRLMHVRNGTMNPLIRLYHLNLSHNGLLSFEFDQSPLSVKVVELDLRHNRLLYPPYADTGFIAPRLTRISAAYNPFICDCKMDLFMSFLDVFKEYSQQHWYSLGFWDSYEHDPALIEPYVDLDQFVCSQPKELKGKLLHTLSFKESCPLLENCPGQCFCDLKKGDDLLVNVNCSNVEALTDLPDELPLVPNASMVLYINRSGLRRMDYRPYLTRLSEIHAANSRLSSVSPGAMEALANIRQLNLDHNQLRSLPSVTQNLTLAWAVNISLSNNPWTCGCHDLWMPQWLDKHQHALYDLGNMQCRWTGKKVTDLDASDLRCDVFNYLPSVITLAALLGLGVVLASLLVKFKLEVLVFLYTRFRVRPFDMYRYNYKGQPYQFDVFVSFSQHDYHWVVEKLMDQLENRPKPYRLCIHLRDFPVGVPIADNVNWAINSSRCTLLVLTKDFLESEWCRHEFRQAHARLLKDPRAKLIIVVHGPVDARNLDRELLAYLRTNTYLKTEDKWFWSKLEYALPAPQPPRVMMVGPEGGGLVMDEEVVNQGRPARVDPPPPPPRPGAVPAEVEMDILLPPALAAGDVYPKM